MRVWLDDMRPAPEGWVRAVNMAEAVKLLEENEVEELSLDHDLGPMPPCDECELRACDQIECRCSCHRELQPTGYDLVKWMAETGRWSTIKPVVHSQNPVGRANMLSTINRYWFNPRLH